MDTKYVKDLIDDATDAIANIFHEVWNRFDNIENQIADLKRWVVFLSISTMLLIILITTIMIHHFLKIKKEMLYLHKENLTLQKNIIGLLNKPTESDKERNQENDANTSKNNTSK